MDAYLDFFFAYTLPPPNLNSWVHPCLKSYRQCVFVQSEISLRVLGFTCAFISERLKLKDITELHYVMESKGRRGVG